MHYYCNLVIKVDNNDQLFNFSNTYNNIRKLAVENQVP